MFKKWQDYALTHMMWSGNDVVIIRKLDLQRAQAPFCATIFLSISFRISALGWRFCAWQLVREGPGSEISRALAACLDSEAGRRILAKDLARADIATQSRNRLATRLAHDDCGLGNASGAEGVPAERINTHSGPTCSSLQEPSNRVSVQTASRDMSIAADRPEDGTVGNSGSSEPLLERADRARILTGSEGQTHFSSRALLARLRFANADDDTVGGELQVIHMDTRQLRAAKSARESSQNDCGVTESDHVLAPGGDDSADVRPEKRVLSALRGADRSPDSFESLAADEVAGRGRRIRKDCCLVCLGDRGETAPDSA